MSKNWIKLLIIIAGVIVLIGLGYAIYYLFVSDRRISHEKSNNSADLSGIVVGHSPILYHTITQS
jgi:flagellar basal body-associated protein FliL